MDLNVKHPYYAEPCNYYSNDCTEEHETMTECLDEWEGEDIDRNQVFRWDVAEDMSVQIVVILQRKGIYYVVKVAKMTESEQPRFEKYLKKHYDNLQKIWSPYGSS